MGGQMPAGNVSHPSGNIDGINTPPKNAPQTEQQTSQPQAQIQQVSSQSATPPQQQQQQPQQPQMTQQIQQETHIQQPQTQQPPTAVQQNPSTNLTQQQQQQHSIASLTAAANVIVEGVNSLVEAQASAGGNEDGDRYDKYSFFYIHEWKISSYYKIPLVYISI